MINEKFNQHFSLNKPFDNSSKFRKFGKEILSGLLGGISYFHGDHLVDRETAFDEDSFESHQLTGYPEGPHELFTLVPSRPFFPRGFLWDEGFHLLPLLKYDSDLVMEIMKSWFSLIDDDGWIAREQILGPEPVSYTHLKATVSWFVMKGKILVSKTTNLLMANTGSSGPSYLVGVIELIARTVPSSMEFEIVNS